jgi:hypothetical protein
MSEFTDKLRDKWESITPRERRLVVVLGIAIPTVLIIFLGTKISGGLDDREHRIRRERKALEVLSDLRVRGGDSKQVDEALIELKKGQPIVPETYVGKAFDKIQIARPTVTPGNNVTKDGIVTKTVRFEVHDLTVTQAKDLLEALETGSKVVVVSALTINRKFRDEDKDKLDLKLEVTTYAYENQPGAGSGSAGSGSGPS